MQEEEKAEKQSGGRAERIRRFVLALFIGGVGGAVFAWANLPLPWMLGAMVATTIAAFSGVRTAIPMVPRQIFITVLGVMLGSAFTPDLGQRIFTWIEGLGLLLLYMPVTTLVCYVYFRKLARFDGTTAYFSAAPGGFNEMVLVGEEMGGNMRAIALVHSVRILIVVFTIPFYFRFFSPGFAATPPPAGGAALGLDMEMLDAAILFACAALGWPLARMFRMPAAQLLGPMLLSAAVHLMGLTSSKPPFLLVAFAQVMMGAGVGSRFSGLAFRDVARVLLLAVGSALLMLVVTAFFTWASLGLTSLSPDAITLSLSPGGLTEMALVALALGVETAFVSAMHVIRIGLVVVFAPLFFRLVLHRPP